MEKTENRAAFAEIPCDRELPFPRVSSHQGMCRVAPGNSLPAYGMAVALGAPEIEFDLWESKDGEIVACHDGCTLETVSDGSGPIWNYTLAQLKTLDFSLGDPHFRGLRIPTFEDILRAFGRRTIFNVHVKYTPEAPYPAEDALDRIAALLDAYRCTAHAYVLCDSDDGARYLRKTRPEIGLCALTGRDVDVVERALRIGAERVTIDQAFFSRELVQRAKAAGLIVNVGCADTPADAIAFLEAGADTVMTNEYLPIAAAVRDYLSGAQGSRA